MDIRAAWLLWLAAGLQLVHFELAGIRAEAESLLGLSLMVPIFGLVAGWLVVNLPKRGAVFRTAILAILAGGLMNATAIAANGRMPYSEWAARAAHVSAERKANGDLSPKHVAAGDGTRLLWLGDVIAVPPIEKVISVGDIVLLLGVAALLAVGMRTPPAGRPASRQMVPASSSATRTSTRSSLATTNADTPAKTHHHGKSI
jgi:hypothetical protein